MIICTRVYNSGQRKQLTMEEHEVAEWLEYNETFRFGCALFVGHECKYRGYLTDRECIEVSEDLQRKQAA